MGIPGGTVDGGRGCFVLEGLLLGSRKAVSCTGCLRWRGLENVAGASPRLSVHPLTPQDTASVSLS